MGGAPPLSRHPKLGNLQTQNPQSGPKRRIDIRLRGKALLGNTNIHCRNNQRKACARRLLSKGGVRESTRLYL